MMRFFASFVLVLAGLALSPGATAQAPPDSLMPDLRAAFLEPPRHFTQVPFWFWNGTITEDGIRRQIAEMDDRGIYGFTIHARMGLDESIGYMTDRWLDLVRFAVEEAARRDMIVYLYDEGMYPSGSAHGRVVAGRPDLASQGLRMVERRVQGPEKVTLAAPLEPGESLVAIVLLRRAQTTDQFIPQTARVAHGAQVNLPLGEWGVFMFIQTPSRGVIRGVHWNEEDNAPNAPASADLLNPEATARFIAETHDKYYAALGPHFGETIQAIFTDEPDILGRRSKRGLIPWTTGLLKTLSQDVGYDFTKALPFLFGVKAEGGLETVVQQDFDAALAAALNESYYKPLSDWCADHGIALTGHPAGPGELDPQTYFQQPGQDVVWRWVLPGETSLEGPQSTAGKSASSAAVHLERSIVVNEAFGAYGWRLTMSEMKWLTDWLAVRGTNRLVPHALYYSDEPPRLYERPPDLGRYNLWWGAYLAFSTYTNRLSWLMTGGIPIADVGLLTAPGHTPWRAAKTLFETQHDFFYLSFSDLHTGDVSHGRVHVGSGSYRIVLLDGLNYLTPDELTGLLRLADGGVYVLVLDTQLEPHPIRSPEGETSERLLQELHAHPRFRSLTDEQDLAGHLADILVPDIYLNPARPDLRYAHRIKDGVDFYFLTNEGDHPLRTTVSFDHQATPELWNAETGDMHPIHEAVRRNDRVQVPIHLPPRASRIFVFDRQAPPAPAVVPLNPQPTWQSTLTLPSTGWTLHIWNDSLADVALGSWTNLTGLKTFSGTGWYTTTFDVPAERLQQADRVYLDCGDAQAWVQLELNGQPLPPRLWPPFRFDITDSLHTGRNTLRIGVTNTRANELTAQPLPSGLFGPVRLVFTESDLAPG